MKKLFTVILCLLLCTGCTSKTSKKETKSSQDTSSTDSLDDSFYPIVNLGTNLVRETFYQDFSSQGYLQHQHVYSLSFVQCNQLNCTYKKDHYLFYKLYRQIISLLQIIICLRVYNLFKMIKINF